MARQLIVPAEVRDAARKALAARTSEVPDVTYRLASGICHATDRIELGLWALDNPDQYRERQCTVVAALRGGTPGRRWALAAAETDIDIERLLNDASRSDQMLVPQLAAAIAVAWERTIDHATRKARQRLQRSTEGKAIAFVKFPNAEAARYAGLDDLLDKTWEAFALAVAAILETYAHTQAGLVGALDGPAGTSTLLALQRRADEAVAALVAFLDQRARDFFVGDVVFEPQDFTVARAVSAWVSGALPAPSGFTFVDLAALGRLTVSSMTDAQEAILALAGVRMERVLTWIHGFFGQPRKPYEPHIDADGKMVSPSEALLLGIYPGDHIGCLCALVPTWRVA